MLDFIIKMIKKFVKSDLGVALVIAALIFAGVAFKVSRATVNGASRERQVTFDVKETEVEPEPEPEPEQPRPQRDPEPIVNSEPQPLPSEIAPPDQAPSDEPPPPVFGASENSLADGSNSAFAMRRGNTLDKEQEAEFTDPRNLRPYTPRPIYQITEMPRPRSVVKPAYPQEARRAGREGLVILQVDIDLDGYVRKVVVVQSAGFGFDEEAKKALFASRYHPAMAGDAPAAVRIKVPVRFLLTD
jgi:periplasmic protein TonB